MLIRTDNGKFILHFSVPSFWNNLDEDLKSSSLRLFSQAVMKKFFSKSVKC